MTDAQDRVSLALIETGDHKDRVIHILSKVKGLDMAPEQIVNSTPCTIAANVPRHLAEKLQGFLEQAGAMVLLESEDVLFSAEDLPVAADEKDGLQTAGGFASTDEQEDVASSSANETLPEEFPPPREDDWLTDTFPQTSTHDEDLTGDFQAAPFERVSDEMDEEEQIEYNREQEIEESEATSGGTILQLFTRWLKGKGPKQTTPDDASESKQRKKNLTLPSFSLPKFGKFSVKEPRETRVNEPKKASFFSSVLRKTPPDVDSETAVQQVTEIEEERLEKITNPDQILRYLFPALIGFLVGATIMGVWGWSSIRSTQREGERETERRIQQYDQQVAQQIEQHSAGLKTTIAEQQTQIEQLTRQNAQFTGQSPQAPAHTPPEITPSLEPGTVLPAEAAIISAFEALKTRHAQSLEASLPAQQQAGCSRQILLDGKSTDVYAQVVRTFTAKYTTFDIIRSNSLLIPYQAEFKIPFQQDIRIGNSEGACNSAQLQRLPTTTTHHEFGSFYGYWIIQYEYRNGQWHVKPTVIEKNRDLYTSAFQTGSPDSAKFLMNTTLFPEFKNK